MKHATAPSILIVEDELILAKDLQRTLRDLGYDAFGIASSAEDAVARAAETPPDIVLMDIRLTGRSDGIQAAAILQSKYSVIIIYLTAHADPATLERAIRTNPYGYLVKPVNPAELHTTIEVALHKHALAMAREQLYRSEHRLSTIAEQVPVSIGYFDSAGRIQFANQLFRRLADWPNDLRTVSTDAFYQSTFYKEFYRARQRALLGETVSLVVQVDIDGTSREHDIKCIPDRDAAGMVVGVYSLGHDVTELRQSHARIRELAQRLEHVREEERRTLAVALHDGIAQDLFAIKLKLCSINKNSRTRAELFTMCEEATDAIVLCMDETRRIANDLRPVSLDYFHAAAVIRDHARHFGESAHLAIRVTETDPLPNLNESTKLLLFRTAQEALTNVARHARANTVDIVLGVTGGNITMEVIDDGIGIPIGALNKPRSLGLLGIRERFEALGGGLALERDAQKGSKLKVYLPASGNAVVGILG
jgi:PAS domain S-box-containing protein